MLELPKLKMVNFLASKVLKMNMTQKLEEEEIEVEEEAEGEEVAEVEIEVASEEATEVDTAEAAETEPLRTLTIIRKASQLFDT